jgi:hypothetical protein
MTASAVFILDVKGKVIISRNYRGDVPMNCVERFAGHVLEADEADERPVWLEHGTTYVYIKYNNLYIMAVTQRNSNAAMIVLFLYRLVEVCGVALPALLCLVAPLALCARVRGAPPPSRRAAPRLYCRRRAPLPLLRRRP